ncbi:MAG TPA: BofC C-terminal domain-containing protein [Bacillales bacterium]|nr:BofC C-terminal domain-containing protein [Bacillales bacterium]
MRRLASMVLMFLICFGSTAGFLQIHAKAKQSSVRFYEHQTDAPKTVNVYLKRIYVDGRKTLNVKPVTIWSMEDFWARFADWELVDQSAHVIRFQKHVNDISPMLKADGYFGLSPENLLQIYKGTPSGNEAIHSFFHIDVDELESGLRQQLKRGIPIKSKDRYEQVLQCLEKYAQKQ